MARIKAVCFDLDGTLYDLKKQRRKLWRWMLRHPIVLSHWQKETAAMRGKRSEDIHGEIAKRVAQKIGKDTEVTAAVINKVIFEAYPATFSPKDVLPGIRELIEELDCLNIPRAVVSDHPTEAKLQGLGLIDGWACCVDCSALGALKPLPDGLQKAAHALGLESKHLVLIGDRIDTDAEMAETAGATCLIRERDWSTGKDLAPKVLQLLSES